MAIRNSAPPSRRAESGPPPSASPRKRILVVDDDEVTARMLERVLSLHYDVTVAHDGLQGLTLAMATPGPDLILTDVQMPTMDGLTMAKRIKALDRGARLPIIFLTAMSTPKDLIDGIRAGARSYLTKPIQLDELYERVQRSLEIR